MILAFLAKGAHDPLSVAKIAAAPEIVQSWVSLWLCSRDTAVSQMAVAVLKTAVVHGAPLGTLDPEQNLMIRRLFRDEGIYGSLFLICSQGKGLSNIELSSRQMTEAQARLLDFVVDLDAQSSPVRSSQLVQVEQSYGIKDCGLLKYAFCGMPIDEDDDLMQVVYIQTCTKYLDKRSQQGADQSDWPLDFLKHNRIHAKCTQYYLGPEGKYSSWLVSESALYFGAYASNWPNDLIQNKDLCSLTLRMIGDRFVDASRPHRLATPEISNHLSVLGRLPRILSVPDAQRYTGCPSPLFYVLDSALSESENVLNTLAQVFCRAVGAREQAAARVIYFLYLRKYPSFWSHLTKIADTVALSNVALAAIRFIEAFLLTNWTPLPSEMDPNALIQLPLTNSNTSLRNEIDSLPISAFEALLFDDTASTQVVPFLLAPPQSSNSFGGLKNGDMESAEWKIASSKFDLIVNVQTKLRQYPHDRPEVVQLRAALAQRVSMGPTAGFSGVGGEVGTEKR